MQSFKEENKNRLLKRCFQPTMAILLSISLIISSCLLSGVCFFTHEVTLNDNGKVTAFYTIEDDPMQILQNRNVNLSAQDELQTSENDNHIDIIIQRAVDVVIVSDGMQLPLTIQPSATVQDALNAASITLDPLDITTPDMTQKVSNGLQIKVKRVDLQSRTVDEAIPFETITMPSQELAKGKTALKTQGQNGVLTRYYQDTIVDGQITQTEEIGSKITANPIDEVILVGTYEPPVQSAAKGESKSTLVSNVSLDSNGIPCSYSKVLTGRACAYTSAPNAKTATGTTAQPGYVAVNPSVIPYGSKMYIISTDGYVYGYAIAADTGGSCLNGDILVDLYMSSEAECAHFGSRQVNIYFV